jgi:hypothetical protein
VGRAVDEELARLGGLHEARGEVDRVADHRVLASGVRADLTTVDGAGGDAGPERPTRQLEQLQAAVDRPLLVVLVADRGAEARDQQAALVAGGDLAEMTTVAVDHPDSGGQEALQRGDRPQVVRGKLRDPDEGDRDLAVFVHELAPSRAQPLGDGRMEEGGQPPRRALVDRGEWGWPHRRDRFAQAADHRPRAPALQDVDAETVLEQVVVHDDLATPGVLLGPCRSVERRSREHVAEPDGRVSHDGDQQRTGSDAGLHRQLERPCPRRDGLEARHLGLHVERAADGSALRFLTGVGVTPEDGGQRVAGEFRHRTAIERDKTGHGIEPAIQDPRQLLGSVRAGIRQRLAQRREARDVDEQHHGVRGVTVADRRLVRVPEQRPDHVVGHE